jgi:hypothetical protein
MIFAPRLKDSAWWWLPLAYIAGVACLAVLLKAFSVAALFSWFYWPSVVLLFTMESYLQVNRLKRIESSPRRYVAAFGASLLLSVVTAYVAMTVVFSVFGAMGWL